jgi:hypothetical protein
MSRRAWRATPRARVGESGARAFFVFILLTATVVLSAIGPAPPPPAGAGAAGEQAPARVEPAPAVAPPPPPSPPSPPSPSPSPLPSPSPAPAPSFRSKPLRSSVGLAPTSADLGSEADITSAPSGGQQAVSDDASNWTFTLKGYIRAPVRFSVGPRYPYDPPTYSGHELHAPPRIVGASSGDWNYIALAPNPVASVYVSLTNARLSANFLLNTNTMADSSYKSLDQLGGFAQAYVTLKFPDLFGRHGGLAWTVGSFSNRYGNAGPKGTSSGYYATYLFGRTHVAGENLAATFDLSERWELIVEHGFGVKIDVLPFINNAARPTTDYIPGWGMQAHGTNLVHHGHIGLNYGELVKIGAHALTSWSPDDNTLYAPGTMKIGESRLSVIGADVHFDHDDWGNGYLGYSRIWAKNLFPLSDGIQVLHGSNGYGFKQDYFHRREREADPMVPGSGRVLHGNDSGTVDTILGQYIFRLAPLFGYAPGGRDLALAVYGMFNRVDSPPASATDPYIREKKLKFGSELALSAWRYLTFSVRYDRVAPVLGERSDISETYSAISPRLIIKSNWKSKEYIIVNYTRFFLGPQSYPGSPYSDPEFTKADPHLFMMAAIMSF